MSYVPNEPYFEGEYEIDNRGRIVWTFGNWVPRPDKPSKNHFVRNRHWPTKLGHKPKGRRRSTSDGTYVTVGGVAR